MNKLSMALVAALLVSAPIAAKAEEHAAPADAVKTEATTTAPATATETTKSVTLADGTVVQIEGDKVYVVDTLGEKKPAPDGDHAAADGTVIKVKDGMLVTEPAPAAPTEEKAAE